MVVTGSFRSVRRFVASGFAVYTVLLGLVETPTVSAQTFTVLYSFKGQASGGGAVPEAGLIQDGAGNLYGTTEQGGFYGYGTVFRLDTVHNERVLHAFGKLPSPGQPVAAVARDATGNLYGTTGSGGSGSGAVFELGPAGLTVVHEFAGFSAGDGSSPAASVVRDCCGNLYGTTVFGGAHNRGTVYRVDKNGNETVLHSFWGGDGGFPVGPLVAAGSGIFYGTTVGGGNLQGSSRFGTVFRIDTTGKETVLYRFTGGTDGAYPLGGLVLDETGNLYGAASGGGDPTCQCGVVFKLDSADLYTVVPAFSGVADGAKPAGSLARDAAGNLYGTTTEGGSFNSGTIFKVDANNNGAVLYAFSGGADGAAPNGLLLGADGSLYGTAIAGGDSGGGVVFRLTP